MNPSKLVRLYPRSWRARYEDELLAVLESRPTDALTLLDLLLGAVDAHLFFDIHRRSPMRSRLIGVAAIGAGVALISGFLVALGPEWPLYRLVGYYSLGLVALVGILVAQAPARPVVASIGTGPAIAAYLYGLLVLVIGFATAEVAGLGVRQLSFLGQLALWPTATLLGLMVLRIGVYSRAGGLALLIGSPLAMIGMFDPAPALSVIAQMGAVLHAIEWILIGVRVMWVDAKRRREAMDCR